MTNADASSLERLQRIRGEYLEMPCLRLTMSQARRLWGLDEPACASMLNVLVQENFLRLTSDGRYMRTSVNEPPRAGQRISATVGN